MHPMSHRMISSIQREQEIQSYMSILEGRDGGGARNVATIELCVGTRYVQHWIDPTRN